MTFLTCSSKINSAELLEEWTLNIENKFEMNGIFQNQNSILTYLAISDAFNDIPVG
jgi:hypothetical protein